MILMFPIYFSFSENDNKIHYQLHEYSVCYTKNRFSLNYTKINKNKYTKNNYFISTF